MKRIMSMCGVAAISTVLVGCASTHVERTAIYLVERSPDDVTSCLAKAYAVAPLEASGGSKVVTWNDGKGRMLREYVVVPAERGSVVHFKRSRLKSKGKDGYCLAIEQPPT